MKRFLLLLITVILSYATFAQQRTINGVVADEEGKPIEYATIWSQNASALSNEQGFFSLIITGAVEKITLNCSIVGYEKFCKEYILRDTILITLKTHTLSVDEVVVSAPVLKVRGNGSWSNLSPIEIATSGGASGDIYRALQSLPGVQSQQENGKLLVRGGSSRETQTYIDDMHLPVAYRSSIQNTPTRGRFSPFMFDGINFSTGGYSAEYSDALSAVLPLYTKDESNISKIGINPSTIGLAGGGTAALNKGSISFNGDYLNLKPYFSIVEPGFDMIKYPETFSGALQFRLNPSDKTNFKVFAAYDYTHLEQNNFSLLEHNLYINSTFRQVTKSGYNIFAGVSYSKLSQDIDVLVNRSSELHIKAKGSRRFSNIINVMVGAESFFRQFSALEYEVTPRINSAFLITTLYPFKKMNFDIAARVDNGEFSPRVALNYNIANLNLSIAAGKYIQQPEEKYLYANPSIESEKSFQYIAGIKYMKKGRVLRVEAYYKDYKNLVYRGTNDGYGQSKGFDIYFSDNSSIKHLEYRLSYSFNDSDRLYADFASSVTPYYLSRHNFSATLKYNIIPLRTIASITHTYASGRRYNSGTTKPFHGVDLGLTILATNKLIINCSVSNILGTKNQFSNERGEITYSPYNSFIYVGFFISLFGKTAYDVSNF